MAEPRKAAAIHQAPKPVLGTPTISMLQTLMPNLPALLPPDIATEQFRAALWLELSGRAGLANCTVQSLRECAIKAATHGHLPGRDCHFLPFNQKGSSQKVATYVPNYAGVLLSLDRTGKVYDAFAHPVYEGDVFICDHLASHYSHIPAYTLDPPRQQGKVRFYYACIVLKDIRKPHVETMTLEEIDQVRRRAPAQDFGPWVTDLEEMSKKTVLKRASKTVKGAPQLHKMLADADEPPRPGLLLEARHLDNMGALYNMDSTTPTDSQKSTRSQPVVDEKTGEFIYQEDDNPLFDLDASAALDRELERAGE